MGAGFVWSRARMRERAMRELVERRHASVMGIAFTSSFFPKGEEIYN